jgi:NAD+ kinase
MLAGDFWYEHRMMLQADIVRQGEVVEGWDVLNEVVIGRRLMEGPVHLVANLDGTPLTTYVADALIVSTPTGSTAYALAAGGPILPPELRNILLIPVAPHISMDRAIVLSEGSSVSIEALPGYSAVISVDGQKPVSLKKGDQVQVYANEYSLRFVRFQDAGYFYSRIISLMDQHPSTGAAEV